MKKARRQEDRTKHSGSDRVEEGRKAGESKKQEYSGSKKEGEFEFGSKKEGEFEFD